MANVKQVFTLAIPMEDIEWYETNTMLMNMSVGSSETSFDADAVEDAAIVSGSDMEPMPLNGLFDGPLPTTMENLFNGPAPAAIAYPPLPTVTGGIQPVNVVHAGEETESIMHNGVAEG
jgi:hypothetical protein